jgi:hypothetical protein
MGDSPSVGWLLRGTPDAPPKPGWGGRLVRVWDGRKTVFDRLTTGADQAEVFGVVELALPLPAGMTRQKSAQMIFDGRIPAAAANDGRALRFRFAPRDAKVWPYVIRSDFAGLDGRSGTEELFHARKDLDLDQIPDRLHAHVGRLQREERRAHSRRFP